MPETQVESLTWTKSTYTDSGSCVEWARPAGSVLVRDSKRPAGARVPLAEDAWRGFVDWVKGSPA
ncbi:DUF397 domain-containing protein [Streptomyces sp. NPDC002685]|uniref:DUF397 domain-containing protein n=1 Tax=Streptomyces sp. NPDC002685 TaxID=3154540 RepID=UPI00332AD090